MTLYEVVNFSLFPFRMVIDDVPDPNKQGASNGNDNSKESQGIKIVHLFLTLAFIQSGHIPATKS